MDRDSRDNDARITSFNLKGTSPETIGFIDQTSQTIILVIPENADISSLEANVEHTGTKVEPVKGARIDFTKPVSFVCSDVNSGISRTYTIHVSRGLIEITGLPSTDRDRSPFPENTLEAGEARLAPGRERLFFQQAMNNYLLQETTTADESFASRLMANYSFFVLNRLSEVNILGISEKHYEYIYPAGYFSNTENIRVRCKRIQVEAGVPDANNRRILVAYYLNWDKNFVTDNSIVFAINGHFGDFPSREAIGLINEGGLSGAAIGKLATLGIPILLYDDSRNNLTPPGNLGESYASNHERDGLFHTLEDLMIIDQALLTGFARVDGIGLSGGAERLFHFLALSRSALRSAYLAGAFVPLWTKGDAKTDGSIFGFDPDMDTSDNVLPLHLQLADMAVIGASRGTSLAFAVNAFEGGTSKAGLAHELLPMLDILKVPYAIRGDDRDFDGISDSGANLGHEYDIHDYHAYLLQARTASIQR